MRAKTILRCVECKNENYISSRNKSKQPDRLVIQKFCPNCNKKTEHNEKK